MAIIVRADSLALAEKIQQLNIPAVDLRGLHHLKGVPLIETNDRTVVEMAVEHLSERKFANLAFCGFANANYSERRLTFLREIASERNLDLSIYGAGGAKQTIDTVVVETEDMLRGQALREWIENLEKPVGVICCNDIRAQQVLSACRESGVHVPDDVAVVGVDNDEILCGLCHPPLTSVEPDTERIGYRAAELLTDMITGDAPPGETQFIEPIRVVTRESSDVSVVADEDVAAAIRQIRNHACEGITVDQLVSSLPISRTVLEKRFAKHLGTSPKAEINRIRLARIKQLLVETEDSLAKIAEATGFRHPEYMNSFFRAKTGETPGGFRKTQATLTLACRRSKRRWLEQNLSTWRMVWPTSRGS